MVINMINTDPVLMKISKNLGIGFIIDIPEWFSFFTCSESSKKLIL